MMKKLLLITAMTLAMDSMAAYTPLSIKGQNTSKETVTNLQTPFRQATKTGARTFLVETGSKNRLSNPGFEHETALTDWTVTSTGLASAGQGMDITTQIEGAKSAQITCDGTAGAGTCTIYQDVSTTHQVQGLSAIYVKSDTAWDSTTSTGVKVYSRVDGANSKAVEVTNTSAGYFKVPVVLGATSTGVAVEITVAASQTIVVTLDDAFVGAQDLKQDFDAIGPWTDFTPTGTWVAGGSYSGKYRQVGQNLEIQYAFIASGAVTAANLKLALPSGFTVDDDALENSGSIRAALGGNGGFYDTSAGNQYEISPFYDGSGSSTPIRVLYFRLSDGAYVPTSNIGPFTVASGDELTLSVTVPVNELSGSTSIYSTGCNSDIECANEFSAYVASAGTVTEDKLDWINGNATPATSVYTLTFKSGVFTVAPHCTATASRGNVNRTIDVVTTSTTAVIRPGAATTGAASDENFFIFCRKTGDDLNIRRQIVGSFKEVVTTPGVTKPVQCSAKVDSAGGVSNEIGDCFNGNAAITSTSVFTLTFNSGYFASEPNCFANLELNTTTPAARDLLIKSVSSTAFAYFTHNNSTTATAYGARVFCYGFAP